MARKFYGSFTPDAAKVLKKADRICCRVDDDGTVYVTDGCIAYKMAPAEYAAIVQPVVCCEAGNWYIQGGEKRDNNGFDVIGIFRQSVEATANLSPMEQCPLTLTAGKDKTAAAYLRRKRLCGALQHAVHRRFVPQLFAPRCKWQVRRCCVQQQRPLCNHPAH